MFKELYDVLPAYGQVVLTVVIVAIGGLATWKGLRDKNKKLESEGGISSSAIPMFLMMGPVHDALQSIHEIAEQSRTQNAILHDINQTLDRMDRGQQYTHSILENILRDQELMDPRYRRRGL